MPWLNIDKPTKRCIIHTDDCVHVIGKSETSLKGDGELKRDGGWLEFDTPEKAREFAEDKMGHLDGVIIKDCADCR